MYWDDVEAVMLRPFEWVVADCCTSACDLFIRAHGVDLMASYRGQYDGKTSALRIIASAGGLYALADRMAEECSVIECGAEPGAIGVGMADGTPGLIFCPEPDVWVGKSEFGYVAGVVAERSWTCRSL